jgi:hypothetical protein
MEHKGTITVTQEELKSQDIARARARMEIWLMENKEMDQTPEEFFEFIKSIYSVAKKEIKNAQEVFYISYLIKQNPIKAARCHAGCKGKGYRYIDVKIDKGEVHYKLDVCCGDFTSPYALMVKKFQQITEAQNMEIETLHKAVTGGFGNVQLQVHDVCSEIADVKRFQVFRKIHSFVRQVWKHYTKK